MEFKEQESQYWSNFYSRQAINYQFNRDLPYHNNFKQYLFKLPIGAKILELACGIRCDGIELAQAGMKVFETDIANEAVNKAKLLYEQLKLTENGEFLLCDAEKIPFSDGYFDAVFISASFHHLPNPQLAITEMKRVVKSGGLVILGLEPSAWPYYTIYKLLEPVKKIIRINSDLKFHSIADDTTKGFTKSQLKKLCQQTDLEVVKIYREKYLGELYDSGLRFLNKFFNLNLKTNHKIQTFFYYVDRIISCVPLINLTNWHFSIICRKS